MITLLQSFAFLISELLLLWFLFSPALLVTRDDQVRTRRTRTVAAGLFGVAAGVTLLSTGFALAELFGDRADIDCSPGSGAAGGAGLAAQAFRGGPIAIQFDPEACMIFNLGSIDCSADYHGRYERKTNTWTVTGRVRENQGIDTFPGRNAEALPGSLSLWQMLTTFDDLGNLYYGRERIGTVRLESELQNRPCPSSQQAGRSR